MRYRFGVFEADVASRELRKRGRLVRLQEKPFAVLATLLERPGNVVTREELCQRLWSDDTFVDFDNNLNTATRRLRATLGDAAESPRFIETLPKLGYRFIADVERLDDSGERSETERPAEDATGARRWALGVAGVVLLVLLAAAGVASLVFPPSAPGRNLMVVLPFENLSEDPGLDYFTDGLTEEVTTELSRLDPELLGVIGKSSAMKYRDSGEEIQTIGHELGVDYVLEGAVRRSRDTVRVTARLVRVDDRAQVWAQRYDRSWTDALSLQGDVMSDIARALTPTLLPVTALRPTREVHPEAQDAYLKGLYRINQGGAGDAAKALEYFDEAIALDPDHARAHSAKASALVTALFRDSSRKEEKLNELEKHARRALELDPELGEAELARANARLFFAWDFPAAGNAYRRALAASPGSARVHYWATGYFSAVGRHEDALRSIEMAVALNPAELSVLADRGLYYLAAGRNEKALEDCRRILELAGERRYALDCLLRAHAAMGDESETADVIQRMLNVDGADEATRSAFARLPATERLDRFREWELERLLEQETASSLRLARQHALVGNTKLALDELDRALASRSPGLIYVASDRRLLSLHCEPRFDAIVRAVGGETLARGLRCAE